MNTLKENIKEKLVKKYKTKKQKINKLTEGFERTSFDFYNENYDRFFKNMFILAESIKKSNNLINEDESATFDEALIKSGLFKGQGERIKNELANFVARKIELTDEIKEKLKEKVDSVPLDEIGKLFTDVDKIVDMVFDSTIDSISDENETPSTIISAIRKNTTPYLRTADFERNAKKDIRAMIVPVMDDVKYKFDNLVNRLKELIAKEDSKS
jgi:hypothetical protein